MNNASLLIAATSSGSKVHMPKNVYLYSSDFLVFDRLHTHIHITDVNLYLIWWLYVPLITSFFHLKLEEHQL